MTLSRWFTLLTICLFSVYLSIGLSTAISASSTSEYNWNIPVWMPKPIVPVDNPMNSQKVELGRHLFYEQRLSITGKFSCASCHLQKLAFTDGKTVAVGATEEKHPRNSMSLANIAYNPVLTWANPLMTKLENQALVPLFGEHPVEMGMVGREKEILAMLRDDSKYPQMFTDAFRNDQDPINLSNLTKALAAFERTLISVNSPYDKYRFGSDTNAISPAAKRGEKLFNSEDLECFHCHGGINFTDSVMHEKLAFQEIAFHNTGLYNIDGKGSYPADNTGVYEITSKPTDMGRFKAPTLRNIAFTAPYMHDGSIATLEEVIDHYQAGGRTIKTGKFAGIGSTNPFKSEFISGFQLSESEKQDLLAFLQSLTDEDFVENPAFSNPYEDKLTE
ncbi:di-heme enzyme [Anabaena cylindrica FACHB-243]|uniref:Cytochrome-c peroxidase n=1 Tax=Anabaena cylindrica (strain ATCC 27899 / PCC 7122) TaxID=272123 RepID=K9ZJR6_ANACC|nr:MULTISPECIES: methanobactin export MATE transporter MbnM [Anabaena]AFZ59451.1 Cytochrome-c peroxidase [Anabaena cylindrica PCC 7122]MBD2417605.1 di-heme enzyme [Anabaena cylindrica FACHB-243]MBY5283203.1 di-heme enzyme [Anabaena sp. CCAP 1446/1C]MBY5308646.1 di-heme enzyme [Anabaena sp. CCAP 1446/1C]MCM2405367.1 di-heme enzyme [Anabaena sp. CCAP 1446/1C]